VPPSPATGPLYLPHCVVDLDEGTVHTGEERRRLSAKESALLRYLVARPGEVIDRYTLLEDVWGYDSSRVVSRAVDTSICRLRRKLEADPAAPRHLRTVPGEGYRYDPPAAEEAAPPPPTTNLGEPVGGFYGRDAGLAWLRERARPGTATALWGPAGVGKTRLGHQWAAGLHASDPTLSGGAWLCDLRGVSTLAALVEAVGWTLQLAPVRSEDPAAAAARLGDALGWKGPLILLLDDTDSLGPLAGRAAMRWAAAAPEARIVLTTRTRPETLPSLHVRPLSPAASELVLGDRAARVGAALDDLPGVAALVARTEGVPLAIELAAVQLRFFRPAVLAERMQGGGISLPAPPPGAPARPTSVRRALATSWDMLAPDERLLLVASAALRGGIPAGAALAGAGLPTDAVALLDGLVDRSLLVARDPALPEPRFAIAGSVRAFAEEQAAAVDPRGEVPIRLGRWFDHASQGWVAHTHTPRVAAAMARLGRERENLQRAADALAPIDPAAAVRTSLARWWAERNMGPAALLQMGDLERTLDWARGAGDAALLSSALETAGWAQRARGDLAAAAALLEEGIAVATPDHPIEAVRARRSRADVARLSGDVDDAEARCRAALVLARESGDAHGEGHVQSLLGLVLLSRSDFDEAESALLSALAQFGTTGDLREQGAVWNYLGTVAGRRWRPAEARARYARGLSINQRAGAQHQALIAQMGLALREIDAGHTARARDHLRPVLRAWRAAGEPRMQAFALAQIACADHLDGDLDGARTGFDAALLRFRRTDRLNTALALQSLGVLDLRAGDLASARARLGEGLGIAEAHGDTVARVVVGGWLAVAEAADGAVPEAEARVSEIAALVPPGPFAGFHALVVALVAAHAGSEAAPPPTGALEGYQHRVARQLLSAAALA
jgi:DNA-binding winged helix-turn-helix (wHTH) protein/tetratricopeptide (TPR) repeat protein